MAEGADDVPTGDPGLHAGADLEPALPDVVRLRLIGVAADVLGTLTADQVPPTLKVAARFAPRRRAKLAQAALAAELDRVGGFRAEVARVTAAAAPDLAAALRRGEAPAAADPVDLAVLAYLLRPPAWPEIVDRVRAATGPAASPDGDVVGRLRAQRDRERSDHREKLDAAYAELRVAKEETGRLRRELRRAQSAQGSALAAHREQSDRMGELERDLAGTRAAADRRVADVQARLDRVVRDLETSQRVGRQSRQTDDKRLWLLLEAAGGAIAGLRRELAITGDGILPADTVPTGDQQTSDRVGADPQDLDRLLTLPRVHLVVDGYNVTKTGFAQLSLADQRQRLIAAAGALATRTGAEVTIVFDGAERPLLAPQAPRGVRVVFSPAGQTADELIRRLVAAEPEGRPVVVVSTDREVAAGVRRPSVWTIDSSVLVRRLARH